VNEELLKELREYFSRREDIAFAFLFGSVARGNLRKEGDVDVGIYFWPEKGVEWENVKKRYEGENRIALDLERLLHKEVDLIVLNRAKAVLADEIVRKGQPLVIKGRGLFLDFLCIISDEAEYVREWLNVCSQER